MTVKESATEMAWGSAMEVALDSGTEWDPERPPDSNSREFVLLLENAGHQYRSRQKPRTLPAVQLSTAMAVGELLSYSSPILLS